MPDWGNIIRREWTLRVDDVLLSPEQRHRIECPLSAREAEWPDERLASFLAELRRRAVQQHNQLALTVATHLGTLPDEATRRHLLVHLQHNKPLIWQMLTREGE